MPGDEGYVIAQRPELLGYRGDQGIVAAAWQVGPADRAPEQNVADNGKLSGFVKKDDMARRMAWAMAYEKFQIAHGDRISVFQPSVRGKGAGPLEPKPFGLFGERFYQKQVVPMRAFDGQL